MVKFVSVLGIILVLSSLLTLLWPRFSPRPRPEPLAKLHELIMKTPVGQNTANVLGVSDDATVVPITPQSITQSIVSNIRTRISDVILTHAVREITKRFKDLPIDQQEKVLNAFTSGLSTTPEASPSQNLPDSSQDSSE